MTSPPPPEGGSGFGPPPGADGPPPPQAQPPVPPVPQPYGQPCPPQYPYGGPPLGPPGYGVPPPRKGNAGRVLAVIAVCVAGVLGLALLSWYGNNIAGKDSSSPSDAGGTKYHVTMPRTLVDGKYELAKDMSDESRAKNPDLGAGDQQYVGMYNGSSAQEQLLYLGLNSDAVGGGVGHGDEMLDGMEQDPAVDVAVPRREITPPGAGDPLTCEVVTKTQGGRELSIATCAWSDPGSGASVSDNSYETLSRKPEEIDLKAFAEQVDSVRSEVRKPAAE
ncbi:hypothetical protein [Streptomyces winkii]|uniref:hypothetical protein n=1 Tax=Streptomyces winkii TaxID=3051178 RepID=UPI0028D4308B|nr:hypothetical protein [Streptomyces sp. DSM 40971]